MSPPATRPRRNYRCMPIGVCWKQMRALGLCAPGISSRLASLGASGEGCYAGAELPATATSLAEARRADFRDRSDFAVAPTADGRRPIPARQPRYRSRAQRHLVSCGCGATTAGSICRKAAVRLQELALGDTAEARYLRRLLEDGGAVADDPQVLEHPDHTGRWRRRRPALGARQQRARFRHAHNRSRQWRRRPQPWRSGGSDTAR